MLKEGESIPSFSVPDENGEIVKSADFKGKNIVIYFIQKTSLQDAPQKLMNSPKIMQNLLKLTYAS